MSNFWWGKNYSGVLFLKYLWRNKVLFTLAGSRLLLLAEISSPAILNTRSLDALVAGIHRTARAICDNFGNWLTCWEINRLKKRCKCQNSDGKNTPVLHHWSKSESSPGLWLKYEASSTVVSTSHHSSNSGSAFARLGDCGCSGVIKVSHIFCTSA